MLLSLFLLTTLQSCLFVRQRPPADPPPAILSPLPEISMSDEIVRTVEGDVIAQLPNNWRLVDIEGKISPDVFAVAVNPDYTLAAVFSRLHVADRNDSILSLEGLQAMARLGMAHRERKSGGMTRQIGATSSVVIGARSFGMYQFSSVGSLQTKAAVFTSSVGKHYEFSLTPVAITGKPLPSSDDYNRIFNSILATIQF